MFWVDASVFSDNLNNDEKRLANRFIWWWIENINGSCNDLARVIDELTVDFKAFLEELLDLADDEIDNIIMDHLLVFQNYIEQDPSYCTVLKNKLNKFLQMKGIR